MFSQAAESMSTLQKELYMGRKNLEQVYLFFVTLHAVDTILCLCNGISSVLSNTGSILIFLVYTADLFHPLRIQCSLVAYIPLW